MALGIFVAFIVVCFCVVLSCYGVGVVLVCFCAVLCWSVGERGLGEPLQPNACRGSITETRHAPGAEAVDVMHLSGLSPVANTLTKRLAVLVLVPGRFTWLGAERALESGAVDSDAELCNYASGKHQQHQTTLPSTDGSQCRAGPAPVCRSHGRPVVCAIVLTLFSPSNQLLWN